MTVGLSGTLSADDILSQAEALRKEQEAMLAQRTAAATQAAQQAQSQFQQASEQPPADINPTDAFVQTLLGNLASTIGGEPSYREKVQENLKLSRVSLIQQRKANLEALQGAAERSAKAAQEAGDHEQEVKIRSQIESRNKALDQLNRDQTRADAMERARITQEGADRRQAIAQSGADRRAPGADVGPEDIKNAAESVASGQTEMSTYPIRIRTQINNYIKQNQMKIVPKKARDTINNISAAHQAIEQIRSLSKKINVGGPKSRFAVGTKKGLAGLIQTDPDVAVYDASLKGFLATISRSTGERGVLTDADVARARTLLPNLFDSQVVAERKLKQLEDFVSGLETRTVRTFTTQNPTGGTTAAANDNDPLGVRR